MFLENKIFIFLKNSFVLKFSNKGDLLEISKLPEKINSEPIIIDDTLVFLNKKNKIAIINQLLDLPLKRDNCFIFNPFKLSEGLIGYSPVKQ